MNLMCGFHWLSTISAAASPAKTAKAGSAEEVVVVEGDSDDIIVLEARVDDKPAEDEASKKKQQQQQQQQQPPARREIRNPFRIHVDFAAARDDKYEWDCMQRAMAREERHRCGFFMRHVASVFGRKVF